MSDRRDSGDVSYTEHQNSDGSVHHTWYDGANNRRMSWDTRDDGNGNQDYSGKGHETDQNNNRHRNWD